MASNEGHVHWAGEDGELVTYLEQVLEITSDTEGDPEGSLRIRASGQTQPGLYLPNSTAESKQWDDIPGTSPTLEARADGHYVLGFIRLRLA